MRIMYCVNVLFNASIVIILIRHQDGLDEALPSFERGYKKTMMLN